MDKANLVEYYLDIILGCPHCDYVFELSTHEIPTEGSTYHVCEKCKIPLEIKPISIKIEFKKSSKIQTQKEKRKKKTTEKYKKHNKSISKARLVIKSYGFTTEQFNIALNKIERPYKTGCKPISTETIIKEILARIDNKHESTKT
jgi:transcription initiation factor TFIIIB Brf1 subunit/transcription initiation factor TFIIB